MGSTSALHFRAFALALLPATFLFADDSTARLRERMVSEQIQQRGIRHPRVLQAMRATPRHLYIPTHARAAAYDDHPVPIGYGATISQPYIVALMTELLDPSPRHRILEIGTGSGYQAAILAQLAAEIYSIEIVPELARSAAQTLRSLGHTNVSVRQGDGYKGWPERAPFDRVILTAAPPAIPQALLDQLAPSGRLVAPVGTLGSQELVLIEKNPDGSTRRRTVCPVAFVPMRPGR